MTHTLISMLGKVKLPNHDNYREATYQFANNNTENSRYFGLTLLKEVKADKLVVLGTSGSMWDNLMYEAGVDNTGKFDDQLITLGEQAQQDAVDQKTLDAFSHPLSDLLGISRCELKLIPYGRTDEEQTRIMEIMVEEFSEGDVATLDVTHGLRHLPMLAQQSALLLQSLKQVSIQGIYYGALDLTQDGLTPVMQLGGLLEIDRWSQAIESHDKDGDYSVFVPLLESSGFSPETVEYLKDAAFYEQTNNVQQARGKLENFLKKLNEEEQQCHGHIKLFLPDIKERLSWVNQKTLHQRQSAVAWQALEHGNLLRACIYGFEAFITKLVQQIPNQVVDNFEHRANAKSAFEEKKPSSSFKEYKLLRELRNNLAHSSTKRSPEANNALSSEENLKQTLNRIFETLIPENTEEKK